MNEVRTPIPPEVYALVLQRAGRRCERCGASYDARPDGWPCAWLEVHHRQPVAQGGDHAPENLELLCHTCHVAAAPKSENDARLTVYLPKDLKRRLWLRALDEGKRPNALALEIIRGWLGG